MKTNLFQHEIYAFFTPKKPRKTAPFRGKTTLAHPRNIKPNPNADQTQPIFPLENEKKRLAFSSSLCIIISALGVIAQLVRALR